MRVSVVGASGYTGGEALRLLLGHPQVTIHQVTSESNAGKLVHVTHPNLRGATKLKYSSIKDLEPVDCLFICLPNGLSQDRMEAFLNLAPRIIDFGADYRLRDLADYEKYYGEKHRAPQHIGKFIYGCPELHREEIRAATLVSGCGCIATSAIVALYPLFAAGIVKDNSVMIDAKVGSSAAGASPSLGSHHPERAGSLRSFKPTGHRHVAEISEQLTNQNGKPQVYLTATSTDAVRGILSTSQIFLKNNLNDLEIRTIYRDYYKDEPFVRIVKESKGIYRYPEPKYVIGTNFIDIGYEVEPETGRVVVISAIDNLVKGSAGHAIQSLNLMSGFKETTSLEFLGLHPV
ncbi:N-acetyl-gamma-glutamyl-phosphate reductase [bacterium]|nr:N-acetyl-gamma-glutamyl-phosphate reductase [bacterium]